MTSRFHPGFVYHKDTIPALALTYKQGAFINNSAVSTHTFAAQAIGAASSDRWVFVLYAAKNPGGDLALNSMTIGGVTATIEGRVGTLTTPNTNNASVGMAYAQVPAGTTADIVFNWAGTFQLSTAAGVGIDVYTVVGALNTSSTAQFDSNSNVSPRSWNYSIPKGGVALAIGATSNVTESFTGNLTVDDNGVAYTSSLPRYAFSQANTDNANVLAAQSETFTGFASSGQNGPIMGRTYGHS